MNNYAYPAGADTREAPWNKRDNDVEGFEVEVRATFVKTMTLHTSDYFTDTDTNGDDIEETSMAKS